MVQIPWEAGAHSECRLEGGEPACRQAFCGPFNPTGLPSISVSVRLKSPWFYNLSSGRTTLELGLSINSYLDHG